LIINGWRKQRLITKQEKFSKPILGKENEILIFGERKKIQTKKKAKKLAREMAP